MNEFIDKINGDDVYVDIGCSTPDTTDSLPSSIIKQSKSSLLIEYNSGKFKQTDSFYSNFSNVKVLNESVTPNNIVNLIKDNLQSDHKNIKLLDLDIDGYDYFVLKSILENLKPKAICSEINEKIPPPVRFAVKYDKDYKWDNSHFYGYSMQTGYDLCLEFGYKLCAFDFPNILMIRNDIDVGVNIEPKELYSKYYIEKGYPKSKSHNLNVIHFLDEKPLEEKIKDINKFYSKYQGRFILHK